MPSMGEHSSSPRIGKKTLFFKYLRLLEPGINKKLLLCGSVEQAKKWVAKVVGGWLLIFLNLKISKTSKGLKLLDLN